MAIGQRAGDGGRRSEQQRALLVDEDGRGAGGAGRGIGREGDGREGGKGRIGRGEAGLGWGRRAVGAVVGGHVGAGLPRRVLEREGTSKVSGRLFVMRFEYIGSASPRAGSRKLQAPAQVAVKRKCRGSRRALR